MAHAGNVDESGTYGPLANLPPHDVHSTIDRDRVIRELERLAHVQDSLGSALYHSTLLTLAAPEYDLRDVIHSVVKDQLLPTLPRASVWLLRHDEALSFRFATSRVLTLCDDDPAALGKKPEQFAGFNSSRELFSDTLFGLTAYVTPLLLSLSPHVWAFPASRAGGVVIYTLGQAVPGLAGSTAEPLQLFHTVGEYEPPPPIPTIDSRSYARALRWWTGQMNLLFTEVCDPYNYVDASGIFEPRRQLEALLSVEQAFRNVQSLSALYRDTHARRALLFDTLDTLEGLGQRDFQWMCTLERAEATLDDLQTKMPNEVAQVLLPRCRRGIAALRTLQDGFFQPSRRTPDGVRLPDKNGERTWPLSAAVALWLRVVRNAGHAFHVPANNEWKRLRIEALLASHDGRMPSNLSDLAYLYLLSIVADPSSLRRNHA
jgi:hypothetical protein